jgi:hypothetical protein
LSGSIQLSETDDTNRRRKVRRSFILFALIAAAFYFGFIVMSILRASS